MPKTLSPAEIQAQLDELNNAERERRAKKRNLRRKLAQAKQADTDRLARVIGHLAIQCGLGAWPTPDLESAFRSLTSVNHREPA